MVKPIWVLEGMIPPKKNVMPYMICRFRGITLIGPCQMTPKNTLFSFHFFSLFLPLLLIWRGRGKLQWPDYGKWPFKDKQRIWHESAHNSNDLPTEVCLHGVNWHINAYIFLNSYVMVHRWKLVTWALEFRKEDKKYIYSLVCDSTYPYWLIYRSQQSSWYNVYIITWFLCSLEK